MKHIIQKGMSDCGIASLAMMHETSYSTMYKLTKALFAATGRKYHTDGLDYHDAKALSALLDARILWDTDIDENKLIGRKAILIVPCKDGSGDGHAVFWDRDTLYDPSPRQRYGKPGKTAFRVALGAWVLHEDD